MSCDCCGKDLKSNFINVNGGGLLKVGQHVSTGSRLVQEFLSINLHDDENNTYKSAEIAVNDKDSYGQFEWYFCSKKCVRQFFNDWLDKIPDVGEGSGD